MSFLLQCAVNEKGKFTTLFFQNMFFSCVKKWACQHKHAFWQLKFLTGK